MIIGQVAQKLVQARSFSLGIIFRPGYSQWSFNVRPTPSCSQLVMLNILGLSGPFIIYRPKPVQFIYQAKMRDLGIAHAPTNTAQIHPNLGRAWVIIRLALSMSTTKLKNERVFDHRWAQGNV